MNRPAAISSVRSIPAFRFLLLATLLLLGASRAAATVVYVSPDGNDKWSGRLPEANDRKTDGPVASLVAARDAVRRMKQTSPDGFLASPATIIAAAGRYKMTEPLVLTPLDTGTKKHPIVYRSADGAKCVFSGGRRITGFKKGSDGIWRTKIPADFRFDQLFVDGVRATRAKTPNRKQ